MPILEKLTIPLNNQSPNDIVFVVEGTALCGAYLNELKQAYIIPTLEHFNGGSLDEKDSGSYSNFAVYGLVIFHAADVLPGYLTEAYGPIPTPFKVLTTLDKYQFTGGYGEAASHVGEGLATAMQCLQDISSFRNPPLEKPAKKHIILVCNCKPYGLPVTESVGHDGIYRGMTVELLASQMMERGIHLSIMSPRRIPALISLFDRGGGESSTQKTYARDPRHLVLLNGFHLQERPITPKQVSEVPAAMNPPPSQIPQQTPLPPPPPVPATVPQTIQHPSNIPSQVPVSMNQSQASQINVAPPPAIQVQSSQPSTMPTPSSVPTSMQQSMASGTVSMAQSQNSMSPMNINQPMNNSMAMNPPQQNLVMIRNRAPLAMGNMRPMQVQNQLNPNQPMNPGQMNHPSQPMSQAQQMTAGQQQAMNQQQQMMNQAQMLQNQQPQMGMTPQMNMPNQQQQQTMNQGMNPTSMNSQFPNQPQMVSQIAQQIPGQQMNPGMLGNPRLATSMGQQQQGIPGMQQQQQPGQPQQQPNQNMPRWPNQMQPNNPMQPRQPIPRMTNPNQQQVPSSTQPLQSQITNQQPISSPMQQMPQPNQPQQPMQAQQPGHSALLTQLNQPPSIPPKQPVPQTPQAGLMVGPSAINNQQKERQNIWSGVLEWHEKQRGPPDGKIPRQVPCKVSANVVNGEPEVKGDGWPTKLVMQLIPKHIVGSLGGSYLVRDVKTVVFMLQPCENLNSLTRVMDSGYAGCVHFTGAGMQPSACNIKVLILLYSKERATYLGFIPNDQNGFVDRIRKVIQQQKQAQQTTRQGQGFPGTAGIPAQPGMMQAQQPGTVQGQQQQTPQGQQGIVQAQPGGMLPQGSQPMVPQPGMVQAQQTPISSLAQQLGQSGPPVSMGQSPVSALAQQLGQAQQLQQQLQQQQQQVVQNASLQQGGMDSQNQGDLSQIDMERQQNLQTIQQLQQTLLAAQQREQMFQQLQHHPVPGQGPQQPGPGQIHVQVAQQQNQQQQQQQQLQQQQQQQQQLQQQQQQQQQQVRPMMTQQNIGQMRMLRSSVSQANPGLKHLLQQQPGPQNYRMQMPMQQQQRMPGQMPMGAQMPGGPMQQNQQVSQGNQFEDVGILDLLK